MTDRGFTFKRFPLSRRLVMDATRVGRRKLMMHGLIEVDVTQARQVLHEHAAHTGEAWSFTAFILACVGRAVETNRHMHAYRDWFGRLVLFDDVDVNTIIEIDLEGQKFPLAYVVRAANRRTVSDLTEEIRAVQSNPQRGIGSQARQRGLVGFLLLPGPVRRLLWRVILSNPHWVKKITGTVCVTAVGMFGEGGGWGIAIPLYTLNLTLGGIAEKPGVVDGRIEVREVLSVTLDFDHDIIDGAPAARFTQRFKELVESGYGLSTATRESHEP